MLLATKKWLDHCVADFVSPFCDRKSIEQKVIDFCAKKGEELKEEKEKRKKISFLSWVKHF